MKDVSFLRQSVSMHPKMKNRALRLTQVSLQDLSNSYDSATTGVLVLSLQQEPLRRQTKRKPSVKYCNNSALALLGLGNDESETKPMSLKSAVLNFLEVSEPALFNCIVAHLKRIADADPVRELVIQFPSRKYTQRKPPNVLQSAPCPIDPCFHALTSQMPEEGRHHAASRWHEVVLEPVRLVSDAPDDEGYGARNTETSDASNRVSRMWRIATCCGVPNQEMHAAWPAVVVIFRPVARGLTGVYAGSDPLEMSRISKPSACGSLGVFATGSSQIPQFGCVPPAPTQLGTADGDTHRPYEQMVLSALTPIITAVTTDGRGVVYQNGLSVAYFGRRTPPRTPSGQHQEAAEVRPDAVEVLVDHDGLDAVGGVLAELFSLEPEKFERMMTEVCIEGRVWRGIVQVPASCYTPPKGNPGTLDRAAKVICSGNKVNSFRNLHLERPEPSETRTTQLVSGVGGVGVPLTPAQTSRPSIGMAAAACSEIGQGATGWSQVINTCGSACERLLQTTHDEIRRLSLNVEDPLATSTWSLLKTGVPGAAPDQPRQPGSGSTILSCRRNSVAPIYETSISLGVRQQAALPPKLQTCQASSSDASTQQPPQHQRALQAQDQDLTQSDGEPGPLLSIKSLTKAVAMASELASPLRPPSIVGDGPPRAKGSPRRDVLGLQLRAPHVPSVSPHARSPLASNARRSSDLLWPSAASITLAPEPMDGHEGEDEHIRELLGNRAMSMTTHRPRQHGTGAHGIGAAGGSRTGGPVRRCISRQELGIASNSQARTTARVMAFASSLRTTPPVVQQVLQQAMAGNASTAGWNISAGMLGSGAEGLEGNGRSGGELPDNQVLLPLPDSPSDISNRPPDNFAEGAAAVPSIGLLAPPQGHIPSCEITAAIPRTASLGSVTTPIGSVGSGPNTVAAALTASGLLRTGSATHRLSRQDLPCVPGKETVSGQRSRTNPLLAAELLNRTFSTVGKLRRGLTVTSKSGLGESGVSGGGSNTPTSFHGGSFPAIETLDTEPEVRGFATSCVVADAADSDLVPLPASQQSIQCAQQPAAASAASPCWHEVAASRAVDPHTGRPVIVVSQTDVSAKVAAERHLALVTEAEHRLLEQIFPRHVLACLTEEGGPLQQLATERSVALSSPAPCPAWGVPRDINRLATSHAEVTLLFADIQGFTPMCKQLEPRVVMTFLNDLFTRFDRRLDDFGVYKVETIGDCYFVAGGLVHEDEDGMAAVRARESHADPAHAEKVFLFAKAMLSAASNVRLPTTGGPVRVRIGLHTGPVVSGLVGERMPRFCLFGDTVNTASRMESTGVPGCIHVSEATWRLLPKEGWTSTGGIEVKGKGLMNTYLWAPPDQESQALLASHITESLAARSNAGRGSGGAGSGSGGGLQAVLRQRQSILRRQPVPWATSHGGSGSRGSGSGTGGTRGSNGPTVKRLHACSGSGSFPLAWFAGNSFAASAVSAAGITIVPESSVDCAKAADLSAAQLEDFLFNT